MTSYLDLWDKDPFPYYREVFDRHETVVWDDGMNAWMVYDRKNSAEVQRNEAVFDHPYQSLPGAVRVQGGARQVLMLHGDEHTESAPIPDAPFLTADRASSTGEQFIATLVSRAVRRIGSDHAGESEHDLRGVLPAYVICVLLGVPIDDEPLLARCKRWNDDIMRWSETFGDDPEDIPRRARSPPIISPTC